MTGDVNAVLYVLTVLLIVGSLYAWREVAHLKTKLWEASMTAETWQRKYEELVEDVRQRAMVESPVNKVEPVPQTLRKARSSAEVRRIVEEWNGRG